MQTVESYSNATSSIVGDSARIYPYYSTDYVIALVYDISSKENTKLIREVSAEGGYLSARMIDKDVYIVSNKYLYTMYKDYNTPEGEYEELRPAYKDTAVSDDKCFVDYSMMYYFPGDVIDNNYLIIVGFSLDNNNPASINTYLGAGSTIYSSVNNLYVAKTTYTYTLMDTAKAIIGMNSYEVKTGVYKFELNNGEVEYITNGEVLRNYIKPVFYG